MRWDRLVKEVTNKIRTLSPREFEEFVSHLLSWFGFESATTVYVSDKGVDIDPEVRSLQDLQTIINETKSGK